MEKNIDVRSALLKFHDDYYSSNIMTLAVLGSEPLDELCELVTELFHPILNKNVVLPTWSQPFSEKQQQTCVYDVPIKDLRKLTLVFPIPDDRSEFYQTGVSIYSTILRQTFSSKLDFGLDLKFHINILYLVSRLSFSFGWARRKG